MYSFLKCLDVQSVMGLTCHAESQILPKVSLSDFQQHFPLLSNPWKALLFVLLLGDLISVEQP